MNILENVIVIGLVKIIVDLISKKVDSRWLPIIAGAIATMIVVAYNLIALHQDINAVLTMILTSTAYTVYVHDFINRVIINKQK